MAETVRRVVVPGVPVNRLVTVREERVREIAASPLPMRPDRRPPAPTPSYHQRVMAVVTPRQPVHPRMPRGPVRVTGAQLLRARGLQQGVDGRGRPRLGQRELAARLHCSRSALAEAERGLRSALPNVEEWVEAVLRAHGEWDEPDGGDSE